ncbi:metallophosphoesterase family protein [Pontibacter cellulosilyticus]|uniref:Metallophosphoesterase n=1 Tax=Pontibacter cellulosilyticus TaxID=1720253 RepID=A0A923N363_9BACT|nr:metallophosphoesterase [Pontibacter cellulosilyticus]MBC5991309.1 metallophosphoesterase [Pontibacter cellulosilyticus]
MKRIEYFLLLGLLSLCITSCDDLFEFHPNQIRLESHERDLTAKSLARLQQQQPGDTLRILVMGDTQRFYDEAVDFVKHANTFENIDFVIHQGDISDFGMTQEHKWVHDIMKDLKWPYLTVVGNHDLLANGSKVYQQMYGPLNYSFTYGHTKFVFVDTNSREYGFNGKVPDISWLTGELYQRENENFSQAIVVSHVPPHDGDFDRNLEEAYHDVLKSSRRVNLSLFGHIHNWQTSTRYNDNIVYHGTTTVKKRGFTYLKVWANGFDIKTIDY